jgi:opacity protein-like surface antigen
MKTLLLLAVVLVGLVLNAVAADAGKPKAKKPGRVKHMVAFKFKDGASQADIDQLNTAFRELPEKIDVIRTFDMGTNHSPEKLNKGMTNGYLLTFDSEADRDTYLNHPAHKEFGSMATKILADVFVVDFTSDKGAKKSKDKQQAK